MKKLNVQTYLNVGQVARQLLWSWEILVQELANFACDFFGVSGCEVSLYGLFGKTTADLDDDSQFVDVKASGWYIHQKYNGTTFINDIAVVVLSGNSINPSDLGKTI